MSRFAIALAVLGLALAACGGGGGTELTVSMYDTRFDPAEWSVSAGEEISLTAINAGYLEHEFVIVKAGNEITSAAEYSEGDAYWETGVVAGQSTSEFTFTAPEAGEYQVICTIDNHFDGGMAGTLKVG